MIIIFLDIDLTLKPLEPELYLCKPNRTTIAVLKTAYDINLQTKLGKVNELNFRLPYEVEKLNELTRNEQVDLIKHRYIVKIKLSDYEDYFIIAKKPSDNMEDEVDYKLVTCFSLPYELNDKLIRDYYEESLNATQVLDDVLASTIWSIDFIDPAFNTLYRTFDFPNSTVLDCIYKIAETFNALIVWDNENRKISLYNQDEVGSNKGLKFSYGKYLQSLNKEYDEDNFCTRLKIFGKDDLSIQNLNPSGSNYLESFEYFMYPFKRDQEGNVLTHSDYMSDELCHAILDYNQLLESKQGEFGSLLTQKELLQTTLATKENELTNLTTDLNIILDNLDIAQAAGNDTTQLIADKNTKQTEINTKITEINNIEADISSVDSQITILRSEISIENNFTPEQIIERNMFIVEKEWKDDSYIDENDLYEEGKKRFEQFKYPPINISIDIVNFLQCIAEQRKWDRLSLGDIVVVENERLGVSVESKIIEIEYNFEDNNIKLSISDSKDIEKDEDKLIKLLYDSLNTSTKVDMNLYKWAKIEDVETDVNKILNEVWDTAKNAINSGVNNTVEIGKRGITIFDPSNPNKFVRMVAGTIGITTDGGQTYHQVMDGTGVYAERIFGKLGAFCTVRADQIILGDGGEKINEDLIDGDFVKQNTSYNSVYINNNGLTVNDGITDRVVLGEYEPGKYGAKVTNGEIYSSIFSTGAKDSGSGITLTDDGWLITKANGEDVVIIRGDMEDGNIYFYRKADGTFFGKIIRYTDFYPGLAIDTKNSGEGLSLRSADNITILPGSSGRCNVYGPFHVWDTEKDCIECTSAGPVAFHAYELPENKYGDEGVAELVNGECRIESYYLFMECVAPNSEEAPWVIHLTPYGQFTVYVAEIGEGYFIVKSHDSDINGKFAWTANAIKTKSVGRRYAIVGEENANLLESNWEDDLLKEVELDVR